jgi:hypothetical protein
MAKVNERGRLKMATLLKVGDTIVNLDLVTQIYFKPGSVRMYFTVATGKGNDLHLDVVEFFGRDAVALQTYLKANVNDVLALRREEE